MKIPMRSSRGISGVIGAVFLFVMLFTVGTGYFIFVNDANTLYAKTLMSNIANAASRLDENLQLTTLLTSGGHVGFYANDTGGVGVNITAAFLLDSSGSVVWCKGIGVPSSCTSGSPFPVYLNPGKGSVTVDTGYAPASGTTYALKVLTARGSVFAATYPLTATTLAAQALSSGAIGDIYLSVSSFTYYNVTPCTSGSSYTLTSPGSAVTILASYVNTHCIAFSIQVTNYNPNYLTITLDNFTNIFQFWGKQGAVKFAQSWFIANVASVGGVLTLQSGGVNAFTNIPLVYNTPTTLYFVCDSPIGTGSSCLSIKLGNMPNPLLAGTFILAHGWKATACSPPSVTQACYGQNMPYVTTLYK